MNGQIFAQWCTNISAPWCTNSATRSKGNILQNNKPRNSYNKYNVFKIDEMIQQLVTYQGQGQPACNLTPWEKMFEETAKNEYVADVKPWVFCRKLVFDKYSFQISHKS